MKQKSTGLTPRNKSLLTDADREEAAKLLRDRPPVVRGTRAIISAEQAALWNDRVFKKSQELKLKGSVAAFEFFDLAGVAD